MKKNTTVNTIILKNNKLTDDGISQIIEVLKLNNLVVEFDVSGNPGITDFYRHRLRMAVMLNSQPRLLKNTCLRMKNLDAVRSIKLDAYDGERYCNDDSCELLHHYITECKDRCQVAHINLANNKVTDAGCRWLGRLLQSNRTIISLNLDNNLLSPEGLRVIASACFPMVAQFRPLSAGKKIQLLVNQHCHNDEDDFEGDSVEEVPYKPSQDDLDYQQWVATLSTQNTTLQTISYMGNKIHGPTLATLEQQLDVKLKENCKNARISAAQPVVSRKQTIRIEDTPDYLKHMDDTILVDALQDRTRVLCLSR
eukprot:TRINITY_DN67875_c10_g1_i1.p1 TRINITY_DN67875_c10_g1~~TRINITY_DN67875_c10_g1_i1.p1  ORF type:complete len:310 (+),score=48.95 TRINITY_DN67875_c10_g1_i1:115-1044(+)